MRNTVKNYTVLSIITALALSGCGGGGSTPALLGAATATTTSGTVAKSTAADVTVGNVDFATSGATVTLNGDPASSSDLKPGMKVIITGSIDGAKGTASRIEREGEVEGKVSAVAVAANNFIVMGQTVTVTARTVFDGISGLTSLNVGDLVEVDGDTTSSGVIEATRVEVKPATFVGHKFIAGVVKDLDSAAKTFTLRNVTVTFAAAALPAQPLANGQAALVKGALKDGVFVATAIVVSGNVTPPPTPNPTPTPLDGSALYTANCAGCHGAPANSTKKGQTAAKIQAAITANTGTMGSLTLTTAEIQAIATALAVTPTPPPTATPVVISTASLTVATVGTAYSQTLTATGGTSPITWAVTIGALPGGLSLTGGAISGTPTTAGTYSVTVKATDSATPAGSVSKTFSIVVTAAAVPALDGAALYGTNCAGCHGALAGSSKRGRTAAQIQSAITSNRGGMGGISLTAAEIAAIAVAIK